MKYINKKNKNYLFFFLSCSVLLASCSFNMSSYDPNRIVLNETNIEVEKRTSFLLIATTSSNEIINWSSSDDSIATVEDGEVFAWEEGSCVITAYTSTSLATCNVLVTPTDKGIEIGDETRYLVWSDEFEGDALDEDKWGYQIGVQDDYYGNYGPMYWGNNELQYYTEDAVSVEDGNLTITARREEKEGMEFTSARILTRDKAYFTYGYFEAKIKVPAITGLWPAFWMMPQPIDHGSLGNVYGGWPYSGEIDIFEAKGRLENAVDMTIHFGGHNYAYKSSTYHMETNIDEWHTYGIDWREDYLAWYIDGVQRAKVDSSLWHTTSASDDDNAPFDQPFYFLFDLAIGGNYDGGRVPPDDFTSGDMVIDYLRVYD